MQNATSLPGGSPAPKQESWLRRNEYVLHKIHSLTGIFPVGFYLAQHMALNSFTLAGPEAYNGVIGFFEGLPPHLLAALKYGVVWIPLIFHTIYGFVIAFRQDAKTTQSASYQKYREHRYFFMQRISGIALALFLAIHMATTSVAGAIYGQESVNYYENWAALLSSPMIGGTPTFGVLLFYIALVGLSAYHFGYGLWHFTIRWGIAVSEKSQNAMVKVGQFVAIGIFVLGLAALAGFFGLRVPGAHG
jgi:succinate dehydrogenase / fumarate reductase cytochrome b subunit